MDKWEEVKKYLPQYLSSESTKSLLEELDQQFSENISENINNKFYTTALFDKDILFQGDGIKNMPVVYLPESTIHETSVMILSNTCDNEPERGGFMARSLVYAPVIKLNKLCTLLIDNGIRNTQIDSLLSSIRNQNVTQVFYLPAGDGVEEEAIVFLDKVNSCDNFLNIDKIQKDRLFCLSQYAFYLLLFKLSIHLTRVQEKVDRNEGIIL